MGYIFMQQNILVQTENHTYFRVFSILIKIYRRAVESMRGSARRSSYCASVAEEKRKERLNELLARSRCSSANAFVAHIAQIGAE